uniref:Uncharacterized protein n=1 Tax=Bionectria ochroleuca TaxID=29856 RepID=A0A8H7MY47_BIOOC
MRGSVGLEALKKKNRTRGPCPTAELGRRSFSPIPAYPEDLLHVGEKCNTTSNIIHKYHLRFGDLAGSLASYEAAHPTRASGKEAPQQPTPRAPSLGRSPPIY